MSTSDLSKSKSVSRGRLIVTGLVAVAIVAVGLIYLTGDTAEDGSDTAVVTDAAGSAPTGAHPAGSVGPSEQLLDDEARQEAERTMAQGAEADEDVERRRISGRIEVQGGGALPEGVVVYATSRLPYPRMGRFEDIVSQRDDLSWFELPTALTRAALEQQTRVEVSDDGRFELDGVPVTGAFVGVDHGQYYAAEVTRVRDDTEHVVVTLALGATIHGRVRDGEGRPVVGAIVLARSPFDPYGMFGNSTTMAETDETETDAQGRFDLGPVPPGVELIVRARDDVHAPAKQRLSRLSAGHSAEVEVTMLPGAIVRGRVVGLDGAPVADIGVMLMQSSFNMSEIDTSNDGNGKGGMERRRRTDDDGDFAFESMSPGGYILSLRSSDYRPASTEGFELKHGQLVDGLELVADPGLSISGVVHDRDGAPIEDARVFGSPPINATTWWNAREASSHMSVTTDEAGRFAMAGYDEGDIELRVRAEGFLPAKLTVAAGAQDVAIDLDRNGLVSGIVISLVDAEPVTAFEVEMLPAGGLFDMTDMFNIDQRFERMIPAREFESETGEFEIEDVMSGDYDLTVRAPGFGTVIVEGITVAPGAGTKGVVVMMPAESIITGLVLDERTSAPIVGAQVSTGGAGMFEQMTAQFAGGDEDVRTDADGRFSLSGLHEGRVDVTLRHDEHVDLTEGDIRVVSGETVDLGILRMATGGVIHGRVFDEANRFVPDIPVLVSEAMGRVIRRTQTDERGAYRTQGLPAGTYNVMRLDFSMSFEMEGASDFMNDLNFEVVQLAADEEREVDLVVNGEGATLQGTVRDADGKPAAAMITLTPDAGGAVGVEFSSSNAKGEFALKGVAAGRYTLNAIPMDGMGMQAGGQPQPGAIETVTVTNEPVQHHDVRLAGGQLEVRVVAKNGGEVIPGMRVVLERKDDERPFIPMMELMGWRVGEAYTNAEGVATFRHLATGTYAVATGGKNIIGMGVGGWAGTRIEAVRVVEGDPGFPVRVELDQAGTIAGLVQDTAGKPLAGVSVWARDPAGSWQSVFAEVQTDAAGRFALDSVSEGPWDVAMRDDAHALLVREGLSVRRGETTDVEFVLERGVAVEAVLQEVDIAQLDFELSGPYGRVPTELVSLADLMNGMSTSGRVKLGRLLPGSYDVLVVENGARVLFSETVVLSGSNDPHVLVLGP